MQTILDQIYRWQGFGDGFGNWESRCRLKIFHPHPEQQVVIASDLGLDTGTSITNCAGQLASLVVSEFRLDPNLLLWVEHYPDSDVAWSFVEFDWFNRIASSPRWSATTQEQVEKLVGQLLL